MRLFSLFPFVIFTSASPLAGIQPRQGSCSAATCYQILQSADDNDLANANRDCSSYLATIVTPCPTYKTKIITGTITVTSTKTLGQKSTTSIPSTTIGQTSTTAIQPTTTAQGSIVSYPFMAARDIGSSNVITVPTGTSNIAACTPRILTNWLPPYATACNTIDFGNACSCWGAQQTTSTLKWKTSTMTQTTYAATKTIFITVTPTKTSSSAISTKKTSTSTAIVTSVKSSSSLSSTTKATSSSTPMSSTSVTSTFSSTTTGSSVASVSSTTSVSSTMAATITTSSTTGSSSIVTSTTIATSPSSSIGPGGCLATPIINGDFSTGHETPWLNSGGESYVTNALAPPGKQYSDACSVNGDSTVCHLTQTIKACAGEVYSCSFQHAYSLDSPYGSDISVVQLSVIVDDVPVVQDWMTSWPVAKQWYTSYFTWTAGQGGYNLNDSLKIMYKFFDGPLADAEYYEPYLEFTGYHANWQCTLGLCGADGLYTSHPTSTTYFGVTLTSTSTSWTTAAVSTISVATFTSYGTLYLTTVTPTTTLPSTAITTTVTSTQYATTIPQTTTTSTSWISEGGEADDTFYTFVNRAAPTISTCSGTVVGPAETAYRMTTTVVPTTVTATSPALTTTIYGQTSVTATLTSSHVPAITTYATTLTQVTTTIVSSYALSFDVATKTVVGFCYQTPIDNPNFDDYYGGWQYDSTDGAGGRTSYLYTGFVPPGQSRVMEMELSSAIGSTYSAIGQYALQTCPGRAYNCSFTYAWSLNLGSAASVEISWVLDRTFTTIYNSTPVLAGQGQMQYQTNYFNFVAKGGDMLQFLANYTTPSAGAYNATIYFAGASCLIQ